MDRIFFSNSYIEHSNKREISQITSRLPRRHPILPRPPPLRFLDCNTRENMLYSYCVRFDNQNTIIARHFVQHSRLRSSNMHLTSREKNGTRKAIIV